MMIGQWSSDAFLHYIRKQVERFSHNVSWQMLRFEMHWHVTNYEPRASRLDPRTRNHADNAERGRMLVAICLAESGFQLSLCSIEMLVLLMVEASFVDRSRGRGESFKRRFQSQLPSFVPSLLVRQVKPLVSIIYCYMEADTRSYRITWD